MSIAFVALDWQPVVVDFVVDDYPDRDVRIRLTVGLHKTDSNKKQRLVDDPRQKSPMFESCSSLCIWTITITMTIILLVYDNSKREKR